MGIVVDVFRCQHYTACHHLLAQSIVATRTGFIIKQAAADVGVFDFKRIFVFELEQTAFPAAITQGFPFGLGHVGQVYGLPIILAQVGSVDVRAHGVVVERIMPIV